MSALPMTLSDRIVGFARALRDAGVKVNPTTTMSALEAVAVVDILHPEQFYHALQAALAASPQEQSIFAAVFGEYWGIDVGDGQPDLGGQVPGPAAARKDDEEQDGSQPEDEDDLPTRKDGRAGEAGTDGEQRSEPDAGGEAPASQKGSHDPGATGLGEGEVASESAGGSRGGASLAEVTAVRVFARTDEVEIARMRRVISRLLAPLRYLPAGRVRHRRSSGDLDLRRTLRRSMRYGGELLDLRRKAKAPARIDLVVLLDVSGSMDSHTEFMLQFIYALQASARNVESFVFSTRLSRITPYLRRGYAAARTEVARRVRHWSGGTKLGDCLKSFNDRYGGSCSGASTCAIVICDGWDRGDTELLTTQLDRLSRNVRVLLWLNPLLGVPGYQPVARGLQIASRYVTAFLPVKDAESLERATELITRK